MPVPSATELLTRLDKTNHPERMRLLGEMGAKHAGSYDLAATISELATGDSFARQVGLRLAIGATDELQVLHALGEHALTVMRTAAAVAPRMVTDLDALVGMFQTLTPAARKLLLRGIRRHDRCDMAELLFPLFYSQGYDRGAAMMLTLCSDEVVRRHLPRLGHLVRDWPHMARRHPVPSFNWVAESLHAASAVELNDRLIAHLPALRALACHQTRSVLRLLVTLMPESNMPEPMMDLLGALVRRHPRGVLQLLDMQGPRRTLRVIGLPNGIRRNLNLFQCHELSLLAQMMADNPAGLADLLRMLPVPQRGELFTQAIKDLDTKAIIWPEVLLEVLPDNLRLREVNRMTALREVRDNRFQSLKLLAHASREQAWPVLLETTHAAVAEERALGYLLLIRNAAVNRNGTNDMLDHLRQLQNEQEPVRCKAVAALAGVSPLLFEPEHLELLGEVLYLAAAPSDTSYRIRAELTALAGRMLTATAHNPWDPRFRFALKSLVSLAEQTGNLSWYGLGHLPAIASPHVFEAFEPLLEAQVDEGNCHLLFALSKLLGKHLRRLEQLQALLARVILMGQGGVRQAAELWLQPKRSRDQRIAELLAWDESAIDLPIVFRHLHRKRQLLLEPFLRGREIQGRFRRRRSVFVLPATRGYDRWLPRQQRAFARYLDTIIHNQKATPFQRRAAVKRKAALPLVRAHELGSLSEGDEPFIREAALRALARLDRVDESLPILLGHIEGDEAKIVMEAVPRCVRFLNLTRFTATLDQLLGRDNLKPTVRKEALRLLGTMPTQESLALLEREWVRSDQPRDVRIALGHAARRMMGLEGAWPMLQRQADDPDPVVVRALTLGSTRDMARIHRERYLRLILPLVHHADLDVRRGALFALRRVGTGMSTEVVPVLAARLTSLDETPEWDQVMDTLIHFLTGEGIIAPFVTAVRGLVRKPLHHEHNAGETRDVPARQRLARMCQRLVGLGWEQRQLLASLFEEVSAELEEDPTLAHESVRLQLAAADPRDVDTFTTTLLSIADACSVRPSLFLAAENLLRRMLRETPTGSPERFLDLFDALVADENTWSSRLATVILRTFGPRARWPRPYAQRLRHLRGNPDPDVRAMALDIHTADEVGTLAHLDPGIRMVS